MTLIHRMRGAGGGAAYPGPSTNQDHPAGPETAKQQSPPLCRTFISVNSEMWCSCATYETLNSTLFGELCNVCSLSLSVVARLHERRSLTCAGTSIHADVMYRCNALTFAHICRFTRGEIEIFEMHIIFLYIRAYYFFTHSLNSCRHGV